MASSKKAKATARTSAPKETPFNRWFIGHIFSLLRRHGNALCFCIALCYIVRQLSLALIAYAGKKSLADLSFALAANISMVWTINIAVTGLSITVYLRERKLHRKTRERLTGRITELEMGIDSKRT